MFHGHINSLKYPQNVLLFLMRKKQSLNVPSVVCMLQPHFQETNSLRRMMQIVECSLIHRRAQGRVSPQPRTPTSICENLFYPICTCRNPPPKFLETYINKGMVNTIPVTPSFMCCVLKQLSNWPIINKPKVTL